MHFGKMSLKKLKDLQEHGRVENFVQPQEESLHYNLCLCVDRLQTSTAMNPDICIICTRFDQR